MLSKNNIWEYHRKNDPTKQRFIIKKLTVGVASVLIGMTFAGTSVASADEVPAQKGNNAPSDTNSGANAGALNGSQVALKGSNTQSSTNNGATQTFTPNSAPVLPAQDLSASLRSVPQPSSWPNKGKNNHLDQNQLETVKNASLADSQNKIDNRYNAEQTAENNAATKTQPATPQPVQNNQDVSTWADLQAKLADSSVDQITITGNITADTPLHVNGNPRLTTFDQYSRDWAGLANAEDKATSTITNGHKVTIIGKNGATINVARNMQALKLGGSGWNITFKNLIFNTDNQVGVLDLSATQGKQSVTFNNVNASGSALYNGGGDTDVYIVGNTTSNVNSQTYTSAAQQGFGDQYSSKYGTYLDNGTTTNARNSLINGSFRSAPNVRAANIIITDGSSLTVNRTVNGDGLVAYDGLVRNTINGSAAKTDRGNVYVGKNAK